MRARDGRVWVCVAFCAALGALVPLAASAAPGDATVSQVKEINAGSESNPKELFDANGILLFSADDGMDGSELWKSDGTAAGTVMLDDDFPANGGIADGAGDSNPGEFAMIGNTVFFKAQDAGTTGSELWKLDPPYTTPVMVANINPGSGDSSPAELINVNGTLLFAAEGAFNDIELWKSVPPYTSATQVHNINPANGNGSQELVEVNGILFFIADDGNGYEVWKSASPFTSATMVDDIDQPDPGTGVPSDLTDVNGTLFFAADDGATGNSGVELWKSAGPNYDMASTNQVEDIASGAADSDPSQLTDVNGTLFFQADSSGTSANEELWKSPPPHTAAATVPIEINPAGGSTPQGLVNIDGTLFFRANSPPMSTGSELFKSNGGPLGAGTDMVANINPTLGSIPTEMTGVGGQVFFRATDGVNGQELWKSPAPFTSATMVANINPTGDSGPNELTELNGILLFAAENAANNMELWKATIEPAPPPVTPVTPAPTPTKKKKCKKKKKKGKKGAVAAKKKKCKKKKKKK